MTEARFFDVESRLAELEDSVNALNLTVHRQEKQIAQLETACRRLIERVAEMAAGMSAAGVVDERPPHY